MIGNVLNALINGPFWLDFCLVTRPLSAPWLNVQTTPSSVLLSKIIAISFYTYIMNAQQSDTTCVPVLTHSLYQTKTTETSSLGLFIKIFTNCSNPNLSTRRAATSH